MRSQAENEVITDRGLLPLTNLTELNLSANYNITDQAVSTFTRLTHLYLHTNRLINGTTLSLLTNLEVLGLMSNDLVREEHLAPLSHLKLIDFGYRATFSTDALDQLKSRGVEIILEKEPFKEKEEIPPQPEDDDIFSEQLIPYRK